MTKSVVAPLLKYILWTSQPARGTSNLHNGLFCSHLFWLVVHRALEDSAHKENLRRRTMANNQEKLRTRYHTRF